MLNSILPWEYIYISLRHLTLGHYAAENVDSGTCSTMLSPSEEGSASFPLLSQGDHPVLGAPSWCLQPCDIASTMQVLVDNIIGDTWEKALSMGIGMVHDLWQCGYSNDGLKPAALV